MGRWCPAAPDIDTPEYIVPSPSSVQVGLFAPSTLLVDHSPAVMLNLWGWSFQPLLGSNRRYACTAASSRMKDRGSQKMATKGRRDGKYVLGMGPTLLGRPRPPYLFEEFALGPPVLLQRVQRGLTDRERRYILWGRIEEYSFRQIAADLNRPLWDLSRLVKKAERDSGVFLDCRFVERVELGRNKQAHRWFCRFCGDVGAMSGLMAVHAWSHLFKDMNNFDPRPSPAHIGPRYN